MLVSSYVCAHRTRHIIIIVIYSLFMWNKNRFDRKKTTVFRLLAALAQCSAETPAIWQRAASQRSYGPTRK